MVPCIRGADSLDFAGFHTYYEDLISKTRENKLTADDFQGTNITLTNPGGIGTVASVPRLMSGQGTIVAVGSIAYPVEWAHAPAEKLKALGVSKVTTMTSTYDHRIIQGAESGVVPAPDRPVPPGRGRLLRDGRARPRDLRPGRHERAPGGRLGPAPSRRRRRGRGQRRRLGRAGSRAPSSGPGRDLAPQGVPHPRAPGGAGQPARRGRARRATPRSSPRAST